MLSFTRIRLFDFIFLPVNVHLLQLSYICRPSIVTLLTVNGFLEVFFHPAFTYTLFPDEKIPYFNADADHENDGNEGTLEIYLDDWQNGKVSLKTSGKAPSCGRLLIAPLYKHFEVTLERSEPVWESSVDSPIGSTLTLIKSSAIDSVDYSRLVVDKLSHGSPIAILCQKLVPFFIEGGTQIDLEDSRWTTFLFTSHCTDASACSFIGFATIYHFFHYPSVTTTRNRISQFVILPPFQQTGLGSLFYKKLIRQFQLDERVSEITGTLETFNYH